MNNSESKVRIIDSSNNKIKLQQSYPKGLIIFSVVTSIIIAILQYVILRREINNYYYRFRDLLLPLPPLNARPRPGWTYIDIYLQYSAMLLQSLIIYGILVILAVGCIRYIRSKISTDDPGKQLLLSEGSNSEFNLKNMLVFRKNGIPYYQLLILIILLGYFISSLISVSLFYGIYQEEVPLRRKLIFPILTIIPIMIITAIIYYLRNRVSLTQVSGLNNGIIFISLLLAFVVSTGMDIEIMVVLGTIMIYTGLVLSVMKLKRPHKVFLENSKEANRFVQQELPNLRESGFSKWNFISLTLTIVYLMMTFLFLYFETTPNTFEENINQSRLVTFTFIYLGIIIIEILLTYTLLRTLDRDHIETAFRYSSLLFGIVFFMILLVDDYYFEMTSLLQSYDIPMGGTFTLLVIPSGILSGFAFAFLSTTKYFNSEKLGSPTPYPENKDIA